MKSFSGGQLLDFFFGRHFFLLSEVFVSGNQVIVRLLTWKRAAVGSSSGGNVILPVLSARSVSNDTWMAWNYMSRLFIEQLVVSCSLEQTTTWRYHFITSRLHSTSFHQSFMRHVQNHIVQPTVLTGHFVRRNPFERASGLEHPTGGGYIPTCSSEMFSVAPSSVAKQLPLRHFLHKRVRNLVPGSFL